MNKTLISICIPNYNNAIYLDACIQSALVQKKSNIEIIFIDDNSSDNSLKIAEKYSDKIKIFKNDNNIGQPKNTNKSILLANGEYIVILHSDDQLLPDFVEKLSKILDDYANVGIAVGERMETDESGVPHSIIPFYNGNYIIEGEKQAKVFMFTSFLPCQVMFRKNIFIKSGLINERHIVNLDGLLWFQISLKGDVAYIQDEICIYRRHNENTTSSYNRKINHMMEYYSTLSAMFDLAKDNLYLKQYFIDAEKRVASLTVRYCQDVIKNKNYELAKRYLILATVFDQEIINDEMYKILKLSLESEKEDKLSLYIKHTTNIKIKRNTSYSPPEGSINLIIR